MCDVWFLFLDNDDVMMLFVQCRQAERRVQSVIAGIIDEQSVYLWARPCQYQALTLSWS